MWSAGTGSAPVTALVPTTLLVNTPDTYTSSGATVSVTGQLHDDGGAAVAGQVVTLWQDAGGSWTQVGSATTDATGAVGLPVTVTSDATYQWRFEPAGAYLSSTSTPVRLAPTQPTTVAAYTDAHVVTAGSQVHVHALLTGPGGTPAAAQEVTLWWSTGTNWAQVASAMTDDTGAVTFPHVPTSAGSYQVRFAGAAALQPSSSVAMPVTVQQSTALTLAAPEHPVAGSPTPLTAALTGPDGALAGQAVQLWLTTPTQVSPLETATTDDAGRATFTVTAHRGDTYQVSFDGADGYAAATSSGVPLNATSTTALTQQASTRTSPYGAPLTVTATLTDTSGAMPAPLGGKPIQLWAQSPDGRWTQVDDTTTDAAGSATFTRTATYQARYAGDADTLPTVGAASTITVDRPTTLTSTAPAVIAFGGAASITGALTWAGTATGVAGQVLELWQAPVGQGWSRATTATTDGAGRATFTVSPTTGTRYQLRYPGGSVGALTATSSGSDVTVAVRRATTATLTVQPATLTVGGSGRVTGLLRWGGSTTGVSDQPVELWANTATGWARIATARTDGTGHVGWAVRPTFTTRYQLRYAGAGTVAGTLATAASSAPTPITVAARLSASIPTTVRSSTTYTVSGSVYPGGLGRTVALLINGREVGTTRTDRSGYYTLRVRFPRGYAVANTYVYATALNGAASSGRVRVRAS